MAADAARSAGSTVPPAEDKKPQPELPAHLSLNQSLGSGAYGEVFLCTDSRTGQQVAVKWIKDFARHPVFGKRILREIRLLRDLRHENLLRLIDVLPVPSPEFDDVYIVMLYMHLDLHRVINSKMKLSESHAQAFTCQILRGLNYLHSAGVVHRDLKPANVLVNKDCTLRIADFGLARGRQSEEELMTDYVVTRWYRAPELMLRSTASYFQAVDLWSMGCILVEMLQREPLFRGRDQIDMLRKIGDSIGFEFDRDLAWVPAEERLPGSEMVRLLDHCNLPREPVTPLQARLPHVSQPGIELAGQFLTFDPTRRISARDGIAHPYLAHLRDDAGELVAPRPFAWDFDSFDATKRALKDRVYAECARLHPEIVQRDAEWLKSRGFYSEPPPATAPGGGAETKAG